MLCVVGVTPQEYWAAQSGLFNNFLNKRTWSCRSKEVEVDLDGVRDWT